MSDPTEPQSGDESEVLKELRKQNQKLQKQLEEVPNQIRSQVQRENVASQAFQKAGFPKLANLFLEKHEGDITDEAVSSYLEDLGLSTAAPEDPEQADLKNISRFSDQIQAKSKGVTLDPEAELARIDSESKTPKELLSRTAEFFKKQGVPVSDGTYTRR